MVKGKVTHMNQSQPQAVPEYQLKQYRHLFNQSKASGALPEVSERVRENRENLNLDMQLHSALKRAPVDRFDFFTPVSESSGRARRCWSIPSHFRGLTNALYGVAEMVSVRAIFVEKICQSLPRGGAVVIGQLPPRSPGAKTYLNIWIGQVHAKYGVNWAENEDSSGVGLVLAKIGKYQFWAIFTQALWSKRVNGQLPPRSPKLKSSAIIWIDVSQPKFEFRDVKDGRVLLDPRIRSHHYLRE